MVRIRTQTPRTVVSRKNNTRKQKNGRSKSKTGLKRKGVPLDKALKWCFDPMTEEEFGYGIRTGKWAEFWEKVGATNAGLDKKKHPYFKACSILKERLASGRYLANAFDCQVPQHLGPVDIAKDLWSILEPDFENSSALGGGYSFSGILVRSTLAPSKKAEEDCSVWLKKVFDSGFHPIRKEFLFQEAKRKTPRLTRLAFDRAWENLAPESWKKSGPKPGSISQLRKKIR